VSTREMIVFDMDGVLVDVTESYRETIRHTVRHFTGQEISYALIQDYKNAGGWNNDWLLSQKIAADLGVDLDYNTVVDYFQKIFLGDTGDGLIMKERWLGRPGMLKGLSERFDFSVFTGRERYEAALTLNRFGTHLTWDPIVAADDVEHGKPHPEGLYKIAVARPGQPLWYVGDTVDDARCARAAEVRFIGIAAPSNPRHHEVVELLRAENAVAVFDDINHLENFFAQRKH
jgi:HAD superfamily hydrolase (TIGR01548 family)